MRVVAQTYPVTLLEPILNFNWYCSIIQRLLHFYNTPYRIWEDVNEAGVHQAVVIKQSWVLIYEPGWKFHPLECDAAYYHGLQRVQVDVPGLAQPPVEDPFLSVVAYPQQDFIVELRTQDSQPVVPVAAKHCKGPPARSAGHGWHL